MLGVVATGLIRKRNYSSFSGMSGVGTDSAATLLGHELMTALTSVAKGMAKNTPARPQMPPNIKTDAIIATG